MPVTDRVPTLCARYFDNLTLHGAFGQISCSTSDACPYIRHNDSNSGKH